MTLRSKSIFRMSAIASIFLFIPGFLLLRNAGIVRAGVALASASCADPVDDDELCELVGYTILACSRVEGDFEGADFNKRLKLDNGMVFEFSGYSYTYSYRPEAVVFVRDFEESTKRRLLAQGIPNWKARSYKVLVRDRIYSVIRIR